MLGTELTGRIRHSTFQVVHNNRSPRNLRQPNAVNLDRLLADETAGEESGYNIRFMKGERPKCWIEGPCRTVPHKDIGHLAATVSSG